MNDTGMGFSLPNREVDKSEVIQKGKAIIRRAEALRNADTPDLLLAGKLKDAIQDDFYLITGNQRDFPACIFSLVTAFTTITEKRNLYAYQTFSILRIDEKKLEQCTKNLQKAENDI